MGETPQTHNSTVGVVESIIHGAVMDVAVNAAIGAAISAVPFLGLPVIKQLFGWVVNWVAGLLAEQLERFVAFTIIDIQTGQQAAAYSDAVLELKRAIKYGDPDETKKAEQLEAARKKFRETLGDLIHYDGS